MPNPIRKTGIPKKTIDRAPPQKSTANPSMTSSLREALGISAEALARLLQVSSKTVNRWEEQAHNPRNPIQISRLYKIKEIVDLGRRIYSPDGLREFLSTPQPVFAGRTAFQIMTIGEYDTVIGALATDLEGLGS